MEDVQYLVTGEAKGRVIVPRLVNTILSDQRSDAVVPATEEAVSAAFDLPTAKVIVAMTNEGEIVGWMQVRKVHDLFVPVYAQLGSRFVADAYVASTVLDVLLAEAVRVARLWKCRVLVFVVSPVGADAFKSACSRQHIGISWSADKTHKCVNGHVSLNVQSVLPAEEQLLMSLSPLVQFPNMLNKECRWSFERY